MGLSKIMVMWSRRAGVCRESTQPVSRMQHPPTSNPPYLLTHCAAKENKEDNSSCKNTQFFILLDASWRNSIVIDKHKYKHKQKYKENLVDILK